MQIRAEEISSIIKEQISDYENRVEVAETGTVLAVGDGIARIYGLRSAMAGETVEFSDGTRGLVLNLEADSVGVAIMGTGLAIKEGDTVKRTGEIAPSETASRTAQSSSSRCKQSEKAQATDTSTRSGKCTDASLRQRSTNPMARTPGVSTTQPPPGSWSRRATARGLKITVDT